MILRTVGWFQYEFLCAALSFFLLLSASSPRVVLALAICSVICLKAIVFFFDRKHARRSGGVWSVAEMGARLLWVHSTSGHSNEGSACGHIHHNASNMTLQTEVCCTQSAAGLLSAVAGCNRS